jgi:hypothetical protein
MGKRRRELCYYCEFHGDCPVREGLQRPIRSCEWFRPDSRRSGAYPDVRTLEPGGLCATCSRRDSCTICQIEGGVWRCEDYREMSPERNSGASVDSSS